MSTIYGQVYACTFFNSERRPSWLVLEAASGRGSEKYMFEKLGVK